MHHRRVATNVKVDTQSGRPKNQYLCCGIDDDMVSGHGSNQYINRGSTLPSGSDRATHRDISRSVTAEPSIRWVLVTDIVWDIDDDDSDSYPDVPDAALVPVDLAVNSDPDAEFGYDTDVVHDQIADWLTDSYGWCVNGYEYTVDVVPPEDPQWEHAGIVGIAAASDWATGGFSPTTAAAWNTMGVTAVEARRLVNAGITVEDVQASGRDAASAAAAFTGLRP